METQRDTVDVLVAGGGTAGVIAAIQAARAGARTAVIEMSGQGALAVVQTHRHVSVSNEGRIAIDLRVESHGDEVGTLFRPERLHRADATHGRLTAIRNAESAQGAELAEPVLHELGFCAEGPNAWRVLHSYAAGYSPDQKNDFTKLVKTLTETFPCTTCRQNFKKKIEIVPLEPYLTNNHDLFSGPT